MGSACQWRQLMSMMEDAGLSESCEAMCLMLRACTEPRHHQIARNAAIRITVARHIEAWQESAAIHLQLLVARASLTVFLMAAKSRREWVVTTMRITTKVAAAVLEG